MGFVFKNLKIKKFKGVILRARTGGVEFLCNHKNSGQARWHLRLREFPLGCLG